MIQTMPERRDHAGASRPLRAPRWSVETTVERRDHCARGICQAGCDSSAYSGLLMQAWGGGRAAAAGLEAFRMRAVTGVPSRLAAGPEQLGTALMDSVVSVISQAPAAVVGGGVSNERGHVVTSMIVGCGTGGRVQVVLDGPKR